MLSGSKRVSMQIEKSLIGYKLIGTGTEKVLALHNWFCDSTSYDPVLPYLDTEKYTYLFMDARGYGR